MVIKHSEQIYQYKIQSNILISSTKISTDKYIKQN